MSHRPVNLARKPFVNARPIVRATLFLWGIGALLMLLNVVLYGRSLLSMEDRRERLDAAQTEIAAELESLDTARSTLVGLDLADQNAEAEFLQHRFEERRFPWTRLFSQLAGVLPRDVRLFRLRPEGVERRRGRGVRSQRAAEPTGPRETWLRLAGEAKSDQALVDLLDALFADPAFGDPLLPAESRQPDGSIQFSLSTLYRADGISEAVASTAESDGEMVEELVPSEDVGVASAGVSTPTGRESEAFDAESMESTPSGLVTPGTVAGAQRGRATRAGTMAGATNSGQTSSPRDSTRPQPSNRRSPETGTLPRALARNASTPGVPN